MFQTERSAELFLDVLQSYRAQHKFLLHAFVIMPDHFHVILTPSEGVTLERAVQYLKGGFSFRAKREIGIQREIWQPKYHDRRIRNREECAALLRYLEDNPVKRRLAERPPEFPFSSANPRFGASALDEFPEELKAQPQRLKAHSGGPLSPDGSPGSTQALRRVPGRAESATSAPEGAFRRPIVPGLKSGFYPGIKTSSGTSLRAPAQRLKAHSGDPLSPD